MRTTLCMSPGKMTCTKCSRPVQAVSVAGKQVLVDPEVMAIVPSGRLGEVTPVSATMTGRRVHAELCDTYKAADERAKLRAEMAEYNRRKGRGAL